MNMIKKSMRSVNKFVVNRLAGDPSVAYLFCSYHTTFLFLFNE